jgi:hypothetical protein
MQVELKSVLHRRTVDLGNQTAGFGERRAIKPYPIPDRDELLWCLPRILPAPPADMDAKLILQRSQSALQCADHTCGDPRRMPIHAHHSAKRLEPERMSQTPQQLVAAIMVDDRFAAHSAKARHPVGEPPWNLPAMQRQICASSSLSHRSGPPRSLDHVMLSLRYLRDSAPWRGPLRGAVMAAPRFEEVE